MIRKAVLASLLTCASLAASAQDAPGAVSSDIGYATPDQAMQALRQKPGVSETAESGWIQFTDTADQVLWSFATPNNPAHPTAVKRALVKHGKAMEVDMRVQCGASKAMCDAVVQQFQAMNASLTQQVRKKRRAQPDPLPP